MLLATSCTGTAATDGCDPAALRTLRSTHANNAEVTVCGTVGRVSRLRRSRSGTHRTFVVLSDGNAPVAVDANVDIMGNFPIRRGERAIVHGEFYTDPSGRDGVHWTHRTDRGTHPPGYVVLDGVTYR